MSSETLRTLIDRAVEDYGFRLALMWGADDIIAASVLTDAEADALRLRVVPELKQLPDPVEPADRPAVQARLFEVALG